MSILEKFYLRGAVAIVLVYLGFLWIATKGGAPADLGRATLLMALVGFGLGLAIVLGLLWTWTRHEDGAVRPLADERERLIEAKADRAGYHALDASLLLLTLIAILGVGSSDAGAFRLDQPTTLVIALVSLSAFAALVRMLAGFVAARRG